MSTIKIAQLQLNVFEDKKESLNHLESKLEELLGKSNIQSPSLTGEAPNDPGTSGCAEAPIDMICLGEMWNCPYVTSKFPEYAEEEGAETWQFLSKLAKRYGVYFQAGTIPEREGDKIYNTGYVFDREGRQIAKHRKMHLFDINIRGRQVFAESETLTPGNKVTVFDTEFCRMGLMICFDGRFPELARLMVLDGAEVILCPAAFNMTTGPMHWEIMHRSRAIDNQCFVIATSDARCEEAGYTAWGHSMVVSPWGVLLSELDEKESIAITEIDLAEVKKVRDQLPLLKARRADIY